MRDSVPPIPAIHQPCPHCSEPLPVAAPLCGRCGRPAVKPAEDPLVKRRLLRALHALIDRTESGAYDAREAGERIERLLAEGYLPDDPALLLMEADWCMKMVGGSAGYSGGWGIRYQRCITAYERLAALPAAPAPPPPASHLRRLWRFTLRAPVRMAVPALSLLIRTLLRARRCARRYAMSRPSMALRRS